MCILFLIDCVRDYRDTSNNAITTTTTTTTAATITIKYSRVSKTMNIFSLNFSSVRTYRIRPCVGTVSFRSFLCLVQHSTGHAVVIILKQFMSLVRQQQQQQQQQ